MLGDSTSQMPMAASTRLPLDQSQILAAMPMPGRGAPPPTAMGAMPMGGAPGGMQSPAAPPQPAEPPFETHVQPDGSILSVITKGLPPGMPPIIIGVHKSPKIPPALQHLVTGQAPAA